MLWHWFLLIPIHSFTVCLNRLYLSMFFIFKCNEFSNFGTKNYCVSGQLMLCISEPKQECFSPGVLEVFLSILFKFNSIYLPYSCLLNMLNYKIKRCSSNIFHIMQLCYRHCDYFLFRIILTHSNTNMLKQNNSLWFFNNYEWLYRIQ